MIRAAPAFLAVIFPLVLVTPASGRDETASAPGRAPDAAREWFRDAKFGLFVHWGVYSLLGRGEWAMQNDKIPIAEYEKLPPRFNPTEFDAAEWVGIAKRAGQRYITITSKHHDGFCMWKSAQTPYNIADATPYRKDVLKMLSDECARQGIKLFFYHSHLDWHHADYFPRGRTGQHSGRPAAGEWGRYLDYLDAQLAELCSPPYAAAGIWFDGWWDRPDADWGLARTYGTIHRLRPEALIGNNHHVAPFPGEDFQMFEQDLPGRNTAGFNEAGVASLPLETCRTMNNSWGYNEGDKAYRPLAEQIRYLVEAVGLGANLLLNVGPMPNGKIPPEAVELLLGMGEWLRANGEAVYGTRPGPWAPSKWGYAVRKGRRAYFHLLHWPPEGVLVLPRIAGLERAALLAGGELAAAGDDENLRLKLPESARNPIDTVLALDFGRDLAGVMLAVPAARIEVGGEETVLEAALAEATGKIKLEGAPKNALGFWTDPADHVVWKINAPRAASFDVELTYACAGGSGGSEFEVRGGGGALRGKVHETGDWAAFVTVPLGLLAVPAGASEIVVAAAAKPAGAAGVMNLRRLTLRAGYESLFDGKTLAGWKFFGKEGHGYVVEDGLLVCPRQGGGKLLTTKEYADFIIRFEFRLSECANNGLGLRSPFDGSDAAYTGLEIQILDSDVCPAYKDKIADWQYHGSIYGIKPAERNHLRPQGEWNVEEVICDGRRVTVNLNGATIVDADLEGAKPIDGHEHPGLERTSGHLGFLGHGSRVEFRNLRLKELRK
jgi:alpha-L-fucosidase